MKSFLEFAGDRIVLRWLSVIGGFVASHLSAFYFGLAPGYKNSFPKNASGPGINLFEFLAFTCLVISAAFWLLFAASWVKRWMITLLPEILLLILITLQLRILNSLRSEQWPGWIADYDRALINFSYVDIVLWPIIILLWIRLGASCFNLLRKRNVPPV